MAKIKIQTPAKEHEHDVLHAHIDFEKKAITYQLGVGAPSHHAALPDDLAEELLGVIGDHAQQDHEKGAVG